MKIIVDGRNSNNKQEIHQELKEKLNFPEYYGGNLDALYDCLCEKREEVEINIIYGDTLEENLNEYANAIIKTIREVSSYNPKISMNCFEGEIEDK